MDKQKFWDDQIARLLAHYREPEIAVGKLQAIGEDIARDLVPADAVEENLQTLLNRYEDPEIDPQFLADTGERLASRLGTGEKIQASLPAGTPPLLPRGSARRALRRRDSGRWPALAVAAAVMMVLGMGLLLKITPSRRVREARKPVAGAGEKVRPARLGKPVASRRAVPTSTPLEAPAAPGVNRGTAEMISALPPTARSQGREPAGTNPSVESVEQGSPPPPPYDLVIARIPPTNPDRRAPASAVVQGEPGSDHQRPIARFTRIEGLVMYARGLTGRWVQAVEGIALLAGDRVDTRTGMARFDVDGATVYANRATVLRLLTALTDAGETPMVNLTKGQVYVADEMQKVHVATSDGLVSPVGTRFDVQRRLSWTAVTVEAGRVEVRARPRDDQTNLGESSQDGVTVDLRALTWVGQTLRVGARQQARLRRGFAPQTPSRVDLARTGAWVHALQDREVLMAEDFADPRAVARRWRLRGSSGFPVKISGGVEIDLSPRPPREYRAGGWHGSGGIETRAGFRLPLRVSVDVAVSPNSDNLVADLTFAPWPAKRGEFFKISLGHDERLRLVIRQAGRWKTLKTVRAGGRRPRRERWTVELEGDEVRLLIGGKERLRLRHGLRVRERYLIELSASATRDVARGTYVRFDNLLVEPLEHRQTGGRGGR